MIILYIFLFFTGLVFYFLCINLWLSYFDLKRKKRIADEPGKKDKKKLSLRALIAMACPAAHFILVLIIIINGTHLSGFISPAAAIGFSLFIMLASFNFRSVVYRFERYDSIIIRLYKTLFDPAQLHFTRIEKDKIKKKK